MNTELKSIDFMQLAFYFDQTKCGACNACTVACKDWNQVNPGPVRWRVQFTYEEGEVGSKKFFPLAYSCNHCNEPACREACPAGAISKDNKTGIVTINRDQCQGFASCIAACPFAKPMIADDKQEPDKVNTWQIQHPAQKCTMCSTDRLNNGMKPACVLSCVGRAMDFGTVEYINATYPDAVRMNPTDFPYAYVNNTNDTGPNIFIKKMPATGGQDGIVVHKSPTYTGKY
jgi:anaerobic dimethyl sulfoxide reductase subunit B (iron-sulfur subunit)